MPTTSKAMQAHNLLAWPMNNIIFAVLVDCELFSAVVDMLESGKTEEKQPQMLDALLGHSVYLILSWMLPPHWKLKQVDVPC